METIFLFFGSDLRMVPWIDCLMKAAREDYMRVPKTDIQCNNLIDIVKKYKSKKALPTSGH